MYRQNNARMSQGQASYVAETGQFPSLKFSSLEGEIKTSLCLASHQWVFLQNGTHCNQLWDSDQSGEKMAWSRKNVDSSRPALTQGDNETSASAGSHVSLHLGHPGTRAGRSPGGAGRYLRAVKAPRDTARME